MRKTKVFVFMLTVAAPVSLRAQAGPVPLWIRDSIHSEILGETRQLRIGLPYAYDGLAHARERYPVLLALDAHSILNDAATNTARALGLPGDPAIPPMVYVGVETPYPDRYRDMTPLKLSGEAYAGSGGGPAFLKFLTTELLPYVARRYRTLPTTVLIGHSMSGLFAAWAYGASPEITGAIAVSPSFQESSAYTEVAFDAIQRRREPGRLFVLNSADEDFDLDSTTQLFAARMQAHPDPATAFRYRRVSGLSHSHTPIIGAFEGLQYIFAPVSLAGTPLKSQVHRLSVAALIDIFEETRERYAQGARTLGIPETLPSSFLITIGAQHQAVDRAPTLLHFCTELVRAHPMLWNGPDCVADAEARLGDTTAAVTNYDRAVELARRMRDTASIPEIQRKRALLKRP